MKEGAIDCERAIVTHHQATEVAEPGVSAFDDPTPLVTSQGATILRRRFLPVRAMRDNQFDASSCQPLTQRITVVGLVGDHPHGLLSRPTRTMTPTYADRRKRGFREPDFRRGCRVKVVSQRKTAAVDHHHPLRPLAPLGFSDSSAPFLAGAKLPSKKDSLHCNCFRSLSSARNARQTFSQMPCSSQSRSRRQQVEGCGYSSGKSCQRAPLRRIHRIPSRTRRLSIHGRPPRRFLRGFGSKGAIFFHCDSVSNGPDRAIGPPSALLTLLIAHSGKLNHHSFKHLSWVMQQLLGIGHARVENRNLFREVLMADSRRRLFIALVGALGALATQPFLFGLQLPRPAREPRPYPDGRDHGIPPNADEPAAASRKVIDKQSQKQIKEDVAKLYEIASQLKGEVERTDANSTLSVSLVKKAQQIEKLAKQIKDLAKG